MFFFSVNFSGNLVRFRVAEIFIIFFFVFFFIYVFGKFREISNELSGNLGDSFYFKDNWTILWNSCRESINNMGKASEVKK